MSKNSLRPGLQFFGNLLDLGCLIQDLRLVLIKTEEIQFPDHEFSADGEALIADIHPDITRKGHIVTLLIALDDQFKIFCQILKDATGQRLKWNDLRGSALERFIGYSEKACGLKSVVDSETRQLLAGLIEVRNCIVHNNSSTDGFSKSKAIEDFAGTIQGLNIDNGYIILTAEACNTCTDIVVQFMEQAYHSALEVYPK